MAPHGETIVSSFSKTKNLSKPPKVSSIGLPMPPRLSTDGLKRTISDISFELSKEAIDPELLPPISEVEDAKCECCGMSEECTPEYIERIRAKYSGKWICGLCAEAVKEEVEKNGGKGEEALSAHMSACFRFNKFGRAYPVLYQAEAMREMLKKSSRLDGTRAKSISPRDKGLLKKGGITRSSSCIPAITKEMNDITMNN